MSSRSESINKEAFTQDKYIYTNLSENEIIQNACTKYPIFKDSNFQIKGRLKRYVAFWQKIRVYDNILDIIENGYKLSTFCLLAPLNQRLWGSYCDG